MDVKTAARTLAIFEAFAGARKPLTLAELSRIIKSPSSSCLYILRTLETAGYVYRLAPKKSFYPTRKMFELTSDIADSEPWLDEVAPLLESLRAQSQETVILGKLQGQRVVYLVVLDGPQTIRYSAKAGDTRPIHSTSIGKAIVSKLAPAQRAKVMRGIQFEKVTETTITDRAQFEAEIEKTAERGYAVTDGESASGVVAIAQPLVLVDEIYAVAVAGPSERFNARFESQLEGLRATCRAITDIRASNWQD